MSSKTSAAQRGGHPERSAAATSRPQFVFARDDAAGAGEIANDTAVPLALILNELITNAAKHGVRAGERGTIRVALAREPDGLVLSVEDAGPGFDLQAVRERSSGLRLVEGLSRQIRGQFAVTRTPTRCVLRIRGGDV